MEPKVGVRYGKTLTQGPCHDALHTVQVNNNKNAGKRDNSVAENDFIL